MLKWRREQDGEHNGKPCYEYHATGGGGREYDICWSCDRRFGYTAKRPGVGDEGRHQYLTERWGIHWAGTLRACKALCEEIEQKACMRDRDSGVYHLPPHPKEKQSFDV